ncbi:unnamed protein product [Prunus brigantina]
MEDVLLCECWVQVSHCPITGNGMKFSHMWRKSHAEFCERSGSARTEMALASRWKILNKELAKISQRGKLFTKKSFNNHQCWEVVKNCSRFKIIVTGPTVLLNETPLHDSSASNLLLESSMYQDSPIQKELRPIGRKAVKAKRWSNSTNDCAKFLEQIALNSTMRIERDMKKMRMRRQQMKDVQKK